MATTTSPSDPGLLAVAQALPQQLRKREDLITRVLSLRGTERGLLEDLNEFELALIERWLESHRQAVKDLPRWAAMALARCWGQIPDLAITYLDAARPDWRDHEEE